MPDQVYDPLKWQKYLKELPQFALSAVHQMLIETLASNQPMPTVIAWLQLMQSGYIGLDEDGKVKLLRSI